MQSILYASFRNLLNVKSDGNSDCLPILVCFVLWSSCQCHLFFCRKVAACGRGEMVEGRRGYDDIMFLVTETLYLTRRADDARIPKILGGLLALELLKIWYLSYNLQDYIFYCSRLRRFLFSINIRLLSILCFCMS